MTVPDPPDPVTYETEIKIALTSAADHDRLQAALPAPRRVVLQRNLFLDTPDGRLRARRFTLRLRLEERLGSGDGPARQALLAVKGKAAQLAGAVHRTDIEVPLDPDLWEAAYGQGGLHPAELEGAPVEFLRSQVALDPHAPLEVIMSFENRRASYPMELGGAVRELLLDRTVFGTGEIDHEIEVEVALQGGLDRPENEETLRRVEQQVRALLREHGVVAAPRRGGKFSRSLHYAARSR